MARSPAGLIVSLRSALQDDAARLRSRANPALLKSKLDDEVRRVCERFAEGGSPPEAADLALLLRRFRKAAAENTLDQFSRREWKQVCWGMFAPPDPLAEQAAFLEALLARLCDGPSRGLCRTLISVYLAQFDPAPRSMQTIAQALAQLVPQWDWSWAERQRRFSLFEPGKAPLEVAKHCTAPNASLEAKLEEAGVKGICRFGGMEAAAFGAGLRLMRYSFENRPTSQSRPRMERTVAWYEKALAEGGTLAFQAQKPLLAKALLLPWQERAPDDALRERITEFLLKHFKDPRIHPQNWLKVPEEATAVLRRWLTRIALEQFFEVVDQVAELNQWMYRRPFWMSYDKRNVIDDAWVLFGPDARRFAKSVLKDASGFGLIDKPRLPAHCIILMRIGGLTIAEVSHMGRCRIWKDGKEAAPQLYRRTYTVPELERSPDLAQVHAASWTYSWQADVADFIKECTGVTFDKGEWRPS
jgi:hypothetical protein